MATPTPEIRERLMLTPMGRALLRLPTRGDRSQAELDRAPFMRHMTIPPDDAFRHRMSALPSPSNWERRPSLRRELLGFPARAARPQEDIAGDGGAVHEPHRQTI